MGNGEKGGGAIGYWLLGGKEGDGPLISLISLISLMGWGRGRRRTAGRSVAAAGKADLRCFP